MSGNTILRADSSHTPSLKRSVPFAQYMGLRRICTTIVDFNIQAKGLQTRLVQRGYSRCLLKKAYQKALKRDRNMFLYKTKSPDTNTDVTRCILTFSHQNQTIRSIINKHWSLLTEDPVLSSYVSKFPFHYIQKVRIIA